MFLRFLPLLFFAVLHTGLFAQEKYNVTENLRKQWMTYDEGSYRPLGEIPFAGLNTIYLELDPSVHGRDFLAVTSGRPYFVFVNGKVRGEYEGRKLFRIDSLLGTGFNRAGWVAIHQDPINARDLSTEILSARPTITRAVEVNPVRPYSHFRDFVVLAGLLVIVLFLVALRLNPKLASDYFSVRSIFSSRDADDSQTSARLTGGSNVQFYVLCSFLIAFYLLIILNNLPRQYALPARFQASGFWEMWWQWLKLSGVVFAALVIKVFIIYSLTRLFGMRGMARFHFFNWIRLLLVVLGIATIVLFMYFIGRGDSPAYYVVFLSTLVAVLIAWIVVAFIKLGGRSGHSMFHLFSYLCATEIIPLLITVKVLYQ